MNFYEVPPDILDQPQELVDWARKAVGIAASSKKPAKRAKARTAV
jgi:TfoX/Sxy family transcriptional regulator of competence genes